MRIATCRPSSFLSWISILIVVALSLSYSATVVNAANANTSSSSSSLVHQTLESQVWEKDWLPKTVLAVPKLQIKAPSTPKVLKKHSTLTSSTRVTTKKKKLLAVLLNPITCTLAKIRDDFHFKGFGMSLYKSLLYKYSCGVAFRLPILANWDGWDRRPQLPSLSSQVCFYYPPTIAVCLSSSMNMEFCKYTCKTMYASLKQFLHSLLYQVLRGFYIVGSWLLYPVLRRVTELPTTLVKPTPVASPITYQSDIQERLGMTISYRWSLTRGREWRVSYWHMYLPTIQVYRQCLGQLLSLSPLMVTTTPNTFFQTKLDWCARHFVSLGVDTSAVPDPTLQPNFACTALVSLNGLYLPKNKSKTSNKSKTTATATTAAAPSVKVSLSREQVLLPVFSSQQSQESQPQQQRDVSIISSSSCSSSSSSSEETTATIPKTPVLAATTAYNSSSTFNKKAASTATATATATAKITRRSNSMAPIARGGDLQKRAGHSFGRLPLPLPPPVPSSLRTSANHSQDSLYTHNTTTSRLE
jgi:hypothetical protein